MAHPLSLRNHKPSATLHVDWDDGAQQALTHVLLRGECQCADCKTIRRNSGDALSVQDDIQLADIRPVGEYGVQLVFSDGHDRGIYPWIFLRSLSS